MNVGKGVKNNVCDVTEMHQTAYAVEQFYTRVIRIGAIVAAKRNLLKGMKIAVPCTMATFVKGHDGLVDYNYVLPLANHSNKYLVANSLFLSTGHADLIHMCDDTDVSELSNCYIDDTGTLIITKDVNKGTVLVIYRGAKHRNRMSTLLQLVDCMENGVGEKESSLLRKLVTDNNWTDLYRFELLNIVPLSDRKYDIISKINKFARNVQYAARLIECNIDDFRDLGVAKFYSIGTRVPFDDLSHGEMLMAYRSFQLAFNKNTNAFQTHPNQNLLLDELLNHIETMRIKKIFVIDIVDEMHCNLEYHILK